MLSRMVRAADVVGWNAVVVEVQNINKVIVQKFPVVDSPRVIGKSDCSLPCYIKKVSSIAILSFC